MRAYFFRQTANGLEEIAPAQTSDPEKEFILLVTGETRHEHLWNVYKRNTPELDRQCVLGVGRDADEARDHIILKGQDV